MTQPPYELTAYIWLKQFRGYTREAFDDEDPEFVEAMLAIMGIEAQERKWREKRAASKRGR